MGKTLAFAVPVIEKLLSVGGGLKPGRRPRVLVMAPTRELAKQVRHKKKQPYVSQHKKIHGKSLFLAFGTKATT